MTRVCSVVSRYEKLLLCMSSWRGISGELRILQEVMLMFSQISRTSPPKKDDELIHFDRQEEKLNANSTRETPPRSQWYEEYSI